MKATFDVTFTKTFTAADLSSFADGEPLTAIIAIWLEGASAFGSKSFSEEGQVAFNYTYGVPDAISGWILPALIGVCVLISHRKRAVH